MEASTPPPYEVRLDPDRALELVKTGATILLLDVPATILFGIDMQIFCLGPRFKGVKMMPPGPHFVYYSNTNRHGQDASPVTGFFVHPDSSQVIVRRWDPQSETFLKISDCSEEERFAEGVRKFEFDSQLGPFNLHHRTSWQRLTNYITMDVIHRLEPIGGDISILAEAHVAEKYLQNSAEKQLLEQIQAKKDAISMNQPPLLDEGPSASSEAGTHRKPVGSGRCFYTPLPHLVKKAGLSAQQLTTRNMDKSALLETVLQKYFEGEEDGFLGEVQFSFVAFWMGQSLEAFSQWKAFIGLVFSCESAPLHTRTVFFTKFLAVIYWQLKFSLQTETSEHNIPMLDVLWLSDDNFLRMHFKDFFSLIQDSKPVDGDLLHHMMRVKHMLETTLGWTFDEDIITFNPDDEYAPVVLSEEDAIALE